MQLPFGFLPGSPPILLLEIGNQAGESPIRTTCFWEKQETKLGSYLTPPVLLESLRD